MRLRVDPFVVGLLVAAALGIMVPITGGALDFALSAQLVVIAGLFALYGMRVPTSDVITGLLAWPAHLIVLALTFIAFPALGWLLTRPDFVPELIVPGIILLCLVPTTMQSSVVTTSIAGGDRAFALIATSISSLASVAATPLLVALLLGATAQVDAASVLRIIAIVLVPFLIGQVLQRWVGAWMSRHESKLKLYDRGSVLLVVYLGFSSGTESDVWSEVSTADLAFVVAACALLFVAMWLLSVVASRPFARERAIAIWFTGSNKSLAAGLPMAAILFPAPSLAMMILPLMIYHQLQIITCTVIANRLGAREQT